MGRWIRALTALAVAAGAMWAAPTATPASAGSVVTSRPNVVVVMMDDLSMDDLPYMPKVRQLLTQTGTTFTNFYASTPECCPSRATFLTGQYIHNHGVLSGFNNTGGYYKLDHSNTLPVWLMANGYHTTHIGKYMNGIGTVNETDRPPGWSTWFGLVDPSTYNYWNYKVNDNGVIRTYGTAPEEYQTDVLGKRAVDTIRNRSLSTQPFFLYFAPLSVHSGKVDGTGINYPVPAPRYNKTMRTVHQPRGADFNEADVSDKPVQVASLPLMSTAQQYSQEVWFQQTIEDAQAADEWIGKMVDTLKSTGQYANTVIIFSSDNGFLRGEHRLYSQKVSPYEPSVHVPLIITGPGFPAGGRVTAPTVMADLAPTIAALTGTTPGLATDGMSILPMVNDPAYGQDRSILLELGRLYTRITFRAIRGPRWKYVEHSNGEREMYNLVDDPRELVNRVNDPSVAWIRDALAQRLAILATCAGPACNGNATRAAFLS